jgi:hypothetical protein
VFGAFDVLRCSRASLGAAVVVEAPFLGCRSSVGSTGASNRIERQAEAFPRLCRSYAVVNGSIRADEHHDGNAIVADVTFGSTRTVLCFQLSQK